MGKTAAEVRFIISTNSINQQRCNMVEVPRGMHYIYHRIVSWRGSKEWKTPINLCPSWARWILSPICVEPASSALITSSIMIRTIMSPSMSLMPIDPTGTRRVMTLMMSGLMFLPHYWFLLVWLEEYYGYMCTWVSPHLAIPKNTC